MKLHQLLERCQYSDHFNPIHTHFHSNYELIYIKNGSARIQIESKSYPLRRGSLIFISRLEAHAITASSGDYERYFVIIKGDHLDDLVANPRLTSVFRNRPAAFCHVFDMSREEAAMELCFSGLVREYAEDTVYSMEKFNAYMSIIFITAFRLYPTAFPSMSGPFSEELFQIQKYLEDHFREDISISELAARYYISPNYLSRRFKQQTGYSPKQYLVNIRLARAKALLLETGAPVSAIAVQCGFQDVSNFIRLFREREGVTPNKFRSA